MIYVRETGGFVQDGPSYTMPFDVTGVDFVCMITGLLTGTGTIAGATYVLDGNAMAVAGTGDILDSAQAIGHYLDVSALSGSIDIVVTGSDASVRMSSRVVGYAFESGETTAIMSGFVKATGSGAAIAVSITTSAGNVVVGGFASRLASNGVVVITQSGTQVDRGTTLSSQTTAGVCTHQAEVAGGATAFSWTHSQAVSGWSAIAWEIVVSGGGLELPAPIDVNTDFGSTLELFNESVIVLPTSIDIPTQFGTTLDLFNDSPGLLVLPDPMDASFEFGQAIEVINEEVAIELPTSMDLNSIFGDTLTLHNNTPQNLDLPVSMDIDGEFGLGLQVLLASAMGQTVGSLASLNRIDSITEIV